MTYETSKKPSENSDSPGQSNDLTLPAVERNYQSLFKEITKFDEGDLILRPNCKFCNHPIRSEAELKWEKTNSYAVVQKMFDDYREQHPQAPKMNYQNIKNHVWNHYKAQEKKIFLKEYGDRLQEFLNYKVNKDKMFEGLSAALEMQLMDIASNPTVDQIKKADAMTKIGKMLVDITVTQARLRGELETINVMAEKFMNIWVHIIGNQKDETVRKQLMDALDTFQEEMEGIALPDASG
jgi:hypothetical protein